MPGSLERFLSSFGFFLFPLSYIYWGIITLRLLFYHWKVFPQESLPKKVISIGNLTLGGTGKTSLVIELVKNLEEKNLRPCILTRGYGRKSREPILLSGRENSGGKAKEVGDEPSLLAKKLKKGWVMVDNNRLRGAKFVLENFPVDVFILDDGFQYLRIKKDLEIVLLKENPSPWEKRLFPSGFLREPLSALKRADVIMVVRGEEKEKRLSFSGIPVIFARREPLKIFSFPQGENFPLSFLKEKKILALAGIGDPLSFLEILKGLGAKVEAEFFPDHHWYTEEDLEKVARRVKKEKFEFVVTTEKDMVRLEGRKNLPFALFVLEIKMKIKDKEKWEEILTETLEKNQISL